MFLSVLPILVQIEDFILLRMCINPIISSLIVQVIGEKIAKRCPVEPP
jgi:hypothetical protein